MSNATTISRQWAEFIDRTEFRSLPASVVEQAKSRVLDSLGTAIAARGLPVPSVALKFVQHESGPCTIFGHERRASAIGASFVNGTLVNGTTHDDFLAKSHPGAVVIPAAFAVGEEEGCSGQQVLTSVVLGYEIVARSYMGGPAMLPQFRASGVPGAIGAAASAGKLQQLGVEGLMNALGLSAVFASGFGEGFLTGTMDVKLNVGWASRSGVSAASLARFGATASPMEFEGKSGFYAAFARSLDKVADATRDLGERYLIEDVRYKERPVCYFVQTPVQLAHQFAQKNQIDVSKVKRVQVHAPEMTYTNPGFQNIAPYATPLQARISAKFTVAAALLGRPIHEYGFYANTTDQEVLALADRVELATGTDEERVYLDIDYDGVMHQVSGAEAETLQPTAEKIVAKFRRVASDFLGARTDEVLNVVLNLDKLNDIRALTGLLRVENK